jgi:ubiquinone/menaquinone biosynthesis C-methylase UbiE
MTLSLQQWHQRYQQQARWTHNLRKYIYDRVGIRAARRILDVGCGTGVILAELTTISSTNLNGLDIRHEPLLMVKEILPGSQAVQGDALYLPYQSASIDICLCHFVLLWVSDPQRTLMEMVRVTHESGWVCVLAEPDYGGRIDYPPQLAQIGTWQAESLREQGANPLIGRELRSLFANAGLRNIEVGVLGGQWQQDTPEEDFESEWQVMRSDLQGKREFVDIEDEIKAIEINARAQHHRVLYVPTFYATGQV